MMSQHERRIVRRRAGFYQQFGQPLGDLASVLYRFAGLLAAALVVNVRHTLFGRRIWHIGITRWSKRDSAKPGRSAIGAPESPLTILLGEPYALAEGPQRQPATPVPGSETGSTAMLLDSDSVFRRLAIAYL